MNKFELQDREYEFPYHYIPTYTKEGFARTRELYWGGEYLSYMKFIVDKLVENGSDSVLDVGCGDGRLCNILKDNKRINRIKGIDLSEKSIAWARLFNPDIEFEVKDVALETEKWDVVTLIEVIEHIPDESIATFIQNIYMVLNEGGKIFLTVPSKNVPLISKHYRHYDLDMILNHIKSAGVMLEIEEMGYIVPQKTFLDKLIRKIFWNRIWHWRIFNIFEWKRLWRNGLIASNTTGEHCYAILKKV